MIYWYSLPARALGAFIRHGVKVPGLSTVIKLVIGFLVVGVFLVAIFTSFDGYFVMMISPVFAPIVVAWASRTSEKYADRVTADLGYGVPLWEIFTGREVARAVLPTDRPHAPDSVPTDRIGPPARAGASPALNGSERPSGTLRLRTLGP
jgi:hypothetical protein